MRRRLYELVMFGLAYFLDYEILMFLWLLEMAIWYFGLIKPVKSNGF